MNLRDAEFGETVVIDRLDMPYEVIQKFKELKLYIGARITPKMEHEDGRIYEMNEKWVVVKDSIAERIITGYPPEAS